jgi:hypothetical protein
MKVSIDAYVLGFSPFGHSKASSRMIPVLDSPNYLRKQKGSLCLENEPAPGAQARGGDIQSSRGSNLQGTDDPN